MLQKACEQCSKTFTVYPSESARRFCSQKCCKQFGQGPNAPNWRGGGVLRTCGYCSKEFMIDPNRAKSGRGKYCSRECWQLDNSVTLDCPICYKPFTIPKTRKDRIKCCSQECRAQYMSQIRGEKHPLYSRIEKACLICGETFFIQPCNDEKLKYCSKSCSEQAHPSALLICQNCGIEFLVHHYRSQETKYCSRTCHWEDKNSQVDIVCELCGKNFTVIKSYAGKARFCSRECYIKYSGPTSIEQLLINEFSTRNIKYEFQYPLGRWRLDFAFPNHRLAVEADGAYWHNQPETIVRDKRKNKDLKKRGWTIIRFGEDEINQSPSACIDKIIQFLDSHTQLHLF